jgi:hypothetical protein
MELGSNVIVPAVIVAHHGDGSVSLRLGDGQGLLTSSQNVKEVETKGKNMKVKDDQDKVITGDKEAAKDAMDAAAAQAVTQPEPTQPGDKDGSDDNVGKHDGPVLPAADPKDGEKGAKDGHFRDHPATEGQASDGKPIEKGK